MFVPPENRHPVPPPSQPPRPKPALSARDEAVLLWVIGMALVAIVLAPIGGSTILEALGYLFRR